MTHRRLNAGHYKRWRRPIVEAGAERYEIRPDA
jgi:hypothetical protein